MPGKDERARVLAGGAFEARMGRAAGCSVPALARLAEVRSCPGISSTPPLRVV